MADAPPEDFSEREVVRAWLATQTRSVAVASAARAALRAIPMLVGALDRGEGDCWESIILPIFRGASCALASAVIERTTGFLTAAQSAEAAASNAALETLQGSNAAADSAAHAVHCACRAIISPDFADDAAMAAEYAYLAGGVTARIGQPDAIALTDPQLALADVVYSRALWADLATAPQLLTSYTHEEIIGYWERLKEAAPQNQDWQVWIDWYQDRLDGRVYEPSLETARVLEIDDAQWRLGPKTVNAALSAIVDRFRDERHAVLAARVRALEEEIRRSSWRATGGPPPRSDNLPPELIAEDSDAGPLDLAPLGEKPKTRVEAEALAKRVRGVSAWLADCAGFSPERLEMFYDDAWKTAGKGAGALLLPGVPYLIYQHWSGIIDAARAFLATWGVPL